MDCIICNGTGIDTFCGNEEKCKLCNGTGEIRYLKENELFCPTCKGHGKTASLNICNICSGTGKITIPDGYELCKNCNGMGSYPAEKDIFKNDGENHRCETCNGKGYIPKSAEEITCDKCDGTGLEPGIIIRYLTCMKCNGKGKTYKF